MRFFISLVCLPLSLSYLYLSLYPSNLCSELNCFDYYVHIIVYVYLLPLLLMLLLLLQVMLLLIS